MDGVDPPALERLRLLQAQLRALAGTVEWQRARWQAVAERGQRQLDASTVTPEPAPAASAH